MSECYCNKYPNYVCPECDHKNEVSRLEAKLAEAEKEIRLLKMGHHFIEKEIIDKLKAP